LDRIIIEVIIMAERINQHSFPIVGKNLRRLRKERNLKAVEVIAKLQLREISINTGTYSKIETGRNNPTTMQLIALKEILDCDYDEFFKL